MCLYFLVPDATPIHGWAASFDLCTLGTTTIAQAPLHVTASSSS